MFTTIFPFQQIEALCIVPMIGIGNAVFSYTAQNIGAHKQKRVIEGYHVANKLVLLFVAILFLILELFNKQIIALFLGVECNSVAISTGRSYLIFMGISSA